MLTQDHDKIDIFLGLRRSFKLREIAGDLYLIQEQNTFNEEMISDIGWVGV